MGGAPTPKNFDVNKLKGPELWFAYAVDEGVGDVNKILRGCSSELFLFVAPPVLASATSTACFFAR